MNIGIVTTWHEGGAGYVSRAYRDVLKAHGNNVKIYARGGKYYPIGDPIWDLPDVTFGKRYEPPRFANVGVQYIDMLHFEKWLLENDISIIIFNEEIKFNTVRRVKKLGYLIGSYIDYYTKDSLPKFSIYDFLLCNTKRHYSAFCHASNAFYIPWGTDILLFKPQPKGELKHEDVVFFHSANFGGMNCRKGTDLLLNAFSHVKGSARLVIHSQVPLSLFGNDAAIIVKNNPRIEFIEKTVPAPGLYHLGDVFVYPTRLEGIGLCVPEALACGLPVITTDNAPMNEFVQDNVNGLLVKVKATRQREDGYYWPEKVADVDDLTQKMQTYVDDKEMLAKHKIQARKSAGRHLDWLKNAADLNEKLRALHNNTNKKRRPSWLHEKIKWWCEARYISLLSTTRHIAKRLLRQA